MSFMIRPIVRTSGLETQRLLSIGKCSVYKPMISSFTKKHFSNGRVYFNDKNSSIHTFPHPKKDVETSEEGKGINIEVNGEKTPIGKVEQQKYLIGFTCKGCNTRSSHVMSKQAYTKGTVVIECPGCKARHLIADHLKIFSDKRITIEDIVKAKGERFTSDIEFEELPESIKQKLSNMKQ